MPRLDDGSAGERLLGGIDVFNREEEGDGMPDEFGCGIGPFGDGVLPSINSRLARRLRRRDLPKRRHSTKPGQLQPGVRA